MTKQLMDSSQITINNKKLKKTKERKNERNKPRTNEPQITKERNNDRPTDINIESNEGTNG